MSQEPRVNTNPRQNNSLKMRLLKVAIVGGISGGVFAFLLFIVVYFFGQNPYAHSVFRLLVFNLAVPVAAVGLTITYVKSVRPGGYLRLWEGFMLGFPASFLTALVSSALVFLFVKYYDYAIFTEYIAEMKRYLLDHKEELTAASNQAQFDMQMERLSATTLNALWFDEVAWKTMAGSASALFMSILLRK